MPFTQDDLAAVHRAIALGTVTVEYHDRRVTYRSVDDLKKAAEFISGTLATAPSETRGYPRRSRQIQMVGSKGL